MFGENSENTGPGDESHRFGSSSIVLTYLLLCEFSALVSIKCRQHMHPQMGVIKGLALLITFR